MNIEAAKLVLATTKAKLYAFGAAVIALTVTTLGFILLRRIGDNQKAKEFEESLRNKETKLRAKAAITQHEAAERHMIKAREVAQTKVEERSDNIQDAVDKWNNQS